MSSTVGGGEGVLDEAAASVLEDVERAILDLGDDPSVDAFRQAYDGLADKHGIPAKPVESISEHEIPGGASSIVARVYRPEGYGPFSVIVYLHGGGGVARDAAGAAGACTTLANVCNAVVVAPEYRLAPEWTFPAGLEDAESVVRWCMSQASVIEGDAERVALVGEGWGANLAIGVSSLLAPEDTLQPVMQLLIDPVLAPLTQTASYERYAEGFGVSSPLATRCREWYFGGDGPDDDRRAWASRAAPVAALPATLIVTCELDPFRDESEDLVRWVAAGGSMVALRRCQGLIHGSVVRYAGSIFRGRMALEQMGRSLRHGLRTGWDPLLALER